MDIWSHGAAHTVTGSCHLVETAAGARLVLDCGLFQGGEDLIALNRQPFGFDLDLDAVVLSHAHLDHTGRLPLLVKRGYGGPIFATRATIALAENLLADSARIQTEDAARAARHGRHEDVLYDEEDVRATIDRMQPIAYGVPTEIAGLRLTPQVAGHIPGSASLLLEDAGFRAVFSGDIGNERKDVLPDPTPCPPADLVLMESTYGDRDHRSFDETLAEFASLLNGAVDRGGKILIPSFALERTQDILFHIARLEERHQIPALPVYVDSPLAQTVGEVYRRFPDELSDEVRLFFRNGVDPFAPKRLELSKTVEDSKAINTTRGAAIVIAGSGMMTGGRILHHLRNHLDDPTTTVLIVGFQPHGGLGRRLIDRQPRVRIFGAEVEVRASVATINGFSAHGDRTELLRWSAALDERADIRLVHGEMTALAALRDAMRARGQHAEIQQPAFHLPETAREHSKPESGE